MNGRNRIPMTSGADTACDNPVEFVSKILVVNGLFYAGMSKDLSTNRSDAVIIESQGALNIILGAILSSVTRGRIDFKRVEVIKVKEVSNEPPMANLLQGTSLPIQNLS